MKQDLEKYLKENRLKLDVDQPDDDSIWEGIRGGMEKKRQSLPSWFWKVASIFILVVSTTYVVVNKTSEKQVVIVTLSDISEDLGNQEEQLKQVVNLKWEEVQQQLPRESTDFQFLLDEMNELDAIYATYQKDLNKIIDNEPVIRAMLDYYEKKIKILNRLLLEIEKQKYHDETVIL
jgi:hypothetical protein